MKPKLITLAFIALSSVVKAQSTTQKSKDRNADILIDMPLDSTQKNNINYNKVFTAVEMEPSFPGGVDKFFTYLHANIKYPPNAVKDKIQGKVFIGFVVEKNGSLSDIKVIRGVSSDIDSEAIRVISNSPKWRPGLQNGRPVRVQYAIPITFKLPQLTIDQQHLMDSLRNLPPEQKIFTAVQHEPTFPGGTEKLNQYIQKNLKYPDIALKNQIQGRVYVNCIIERDGSLSNIRIARSLSPETDSEAIRLIEECPKWEPGIHNGRAVRVAYTIPILFQLHDK